MTQPEPQPDRTAVATRALPWVPLALIAINVAVFAWSTARGVGLFVAEPDQLVAVGGNLPTLTLHGEPWRLVTAMFLHAGLLHLGLNMLCLWSGGRLGEQLFGKGPLLAIYLAAGLVGGIASTARSTMIVSVGASGAIFGVFGAIFGYVLVHRAHLDPRAREQQLKRLGGFMAINLVIGIATPGIDLSAHVGGLLTGFVIAYVIERGLAPADSARRAKRAVLALVASIALTATAVAVLPKPALGYLTKAQAAVVERFQDKFTAFQAAETGLLARFGDQAQKASAGEITDAAFRTVIETELLPAWRTQATAFHSVPRLVPVAERRRVAVADYLEARVRHLEAASAFLATDHANATALAAADAALKARDADVVSAIEAVKVAFKP